MTDFHITTNRAELDLPLIHQFLSEQSYWAKRIPLATVARSIDHSLCFGGFIGTAQVAFARVISDYATFAYLGDVFVLPAHRGNGYSKRLMEAIDAHPQLQGLRRFMLVTSDAQALYSQFGFVTTQEPPSIMTRNRLDIYQAKG
jgi:GNAT superfamily N-acetyltransferase